MTLICVENVLKIQIKVENIRKSKLVTWLRLSINSKRSFNFVMLDFFLDIYRMINCRLHY